jgi:hypothetical protein
VLIPKTNNADSVDHYRPIAVANFKFKVISKILADRLASIMAAITSVQQRGFIRGRNIKDCICLASEAVNVLHKKSFGGNLAIKVDIAKAFDTLDWSFLIRVLKAYGFNDMFCKWIHSILASAKISISINGKLHGFFSCSIMASIMASFHREIHYLLYYSALLKKLLVEASLSLLEKVN